ncbi:MAG: hypothetical protein MRJ96_09200 [Nitrospirales bacterium]|nr:hypothetical protein [Nitrospira sp.]MDR4501609.1 hypothetical protein [Nitrospirales bacterium]
MESYPSPIETYLRQQILACRHPAFFYISSECQTLEVGGSLAHYGLQYCRVGQCITDRVCFLHGLIPLYGESIIIPLLQFNVRQYIDVHLFPGTTGDWVLLLDTTDQALQQQRVQQLAYRESS